MKCSGLHCITGDFVEVSFVETITSVVPSPEELENPPYLAPGWIDLQVNGFAGVDFNSPTTTHAEIDCAIRALRACGVTRFFPTVITGSFENMSGALRNLAAARLKVHSGDSMAGFHVEGPYISPEDGPRGAHPRQWVRPPDLDEFSWLQDAASGLIRLVTLSPEWPEAPRFIGALVRQGIVVSVGHTQATADQIGAAVDAGATMSTHLGNGAGEMLPRRANYLWEQLADDRLTAGFIVDGIHLDNQFLKVALRAKGVEKSVLVTDAAAPSGCAPGAYRLGDLDVVLTEDRRVMLADRSRLAASALSMDHAIGNLLKLGGLSLADAVTMATMNPARACRIKGRQRGLAPGDLADIVQFRFDPESQTIQVEKVFVNGRERERDQKRN